MAPRSKSSPPPLRLAPPAASDEVELGTIAGVFGIQGEVRLFLHHRESDWLHRRREVTLVDPAGGRWLTRMKARSGAGRRVIARVEGVDSTEHAEAIRDWRVVVPRDALPEPAADEFYFADVIGRPAFVDGQPVGTVTAVHATGPVEVLELDLGGETAYVPCLRDRVLRVGRDGVHLAPDALVREEE